MELLELGYDQLAGAHLTDDTAWDLLANTTGAVLAAVALELGLRFRSGSHPAIHTTGEPRWRPYTDEG